MWVTVCQLILRQTQNIFRLFITQFDGSSWLDVLFSLFFRSQKVVQLDQTNFYKHSISYLSYLMYNLNQCVQYQINQIFCTIKQVLQQLPLFSRYDSIGTRSFYMKAISMQYKVALFILGQILQSIVANSGTWTNVYRHFSSCHLNVDTYVIPVTFAFKKIFQGI